MAKKKKQKKKKDEIKRLDIPPIAIFDNIIFSKKECWAYYKVSTVPFDFMSTEAQIDYGKRTTMALSALCQSNTQKTDCHVLITSTPFDIDSWVEQIHTIHEKWIGDVDKSYIKFLESQSNNLYYYDYSKRVTYLGVKLFNRAAIETGNLNVFEYGFKDAATSVKKSISRIMSLEDEIVLKDEEKRAINAEKDVHKILFHSSLRVTKPSSEELLLSIKKLFYPAMKTPYLEVDHGTRIGFNDIVIETGGVINQQLRCLKFNQVIDNEEVEGYRATLSFSRFPKDRMGIPSDVDPFLYYPTKVQLPYTLSSRFTLLPNEAMKKELGKKKKDMADEAQNAGKADVAPTIAMQDAMHDIEELEALIHFDRLAWVQGSYRVTIEAQTYESLSEQITSLKQMYSVNDIVLTWTSGDQLPLFLEEIPGGHLRMKTFSQTTNLPMVSTSGFSYGSESGDPIDIKFKGTKK